MPADQARNAAREPCVRGWPWTIASRRSEWDDLLAATSQVHIDSGMTIPNTMELTLLEATRGGSIDQRAFLEAMNSAISKVVVGQTMTTDDGSSKAQGEVHLDVRQDIVQADADLLCSSFNAGPARWLTEWNFPGAAPPQVWRKIDTPDLGKQAEVEKTVVDMGVARPTLKHIRETYGGDWEPAPMALPAVPAGAAPDAGTAEFAESEHDGIDQFADQLDDGAAEILDGMFGRVREVIAAASSLEEVRERLAEIYSDLDPAALAAVMQRALAAAELAGRFEVEDGD